MKYMIEYTVRNSGLTYDQNFASSEALLNAFGKWKPEEGLNILAFVANLANGGYVLIEAGDPKVVAAFISKFNFWNDVKVVPWWTSASRFRSRCRRSIGRATPRKADRSTL